MGGSKGLKSRQYDISSGQTRIKKEVLLTRHVPPDYPDQSKNRYLNHSKARRTLIRLFSKSEERQDAMLRMKCIYIHVDEKLVNML